MVVIGALAQRAPAATASSSTLLPVSFSYSSTVPRKLSSHGDWLITMVIGAAFSAVAADREGCNVGVRGGPAAGNDPATRHAAVKSHLVVLPRGAVMIH